MRLFNLQILKQKTLDERLAKARAKASTDAIVMPNKMISKLLWQIHSPNRDSLIQAYQKAQMRYREKVRNA